MTAELSHGAQCSLQLQRLFHPDHKFEYRAPELRKLVEDAGFEVLREVGVCEMPETVRTNNFHYSDVLGNVLTDRVDDACLLYLDCRKPE